MSTSGFSQAPFAALDTIIATGSLSSLGNGDYALGVGQEINNTPTPSATIYAAEAIFPVLQLGSAVTAGSGTPSIVLMAFREVNGSYPNPPGTVAAAAPIPLETSTTYLVPGASHTTINLNPLPLGPFQYRFEILNNTGTVLPSSGNTLIGQRVYSENF